MSDPITRGRKEASISIRTKARMFFWEVVAICCVRAFKKQKRKIDPPQLIDCRSLGRRRTWALYTSFIVHTYSYVCLHSGQLPNSNIPSCLCNIDTYIRIWNELLALAGGNYSMDREDWLQSGPKALTGSLFFWWDSKCDKVVSGKTTFKVNLRYSLLAKGEMLQRLTVCWTRRGGGRKKVCSKLGQHIPKQSPTRLLLGKVARAGL